ncbi:MAG: Kdo domain containing protein [Winogradskyella sp.]|uniref:lipopolysaccharide kinase InaA family protein n=1 Tax=Winogradskyella sp. TaxID=1883156 RepID=UPI0025FEB086|nr:lipopolysaccharide kinase InaA family protein [Winogradskyella sp.]NRB58544.1 Kdo domain containing protein [Winogradskyella sp.]
MKLSKKIHEDFKDEVSFLDNIISKFETEGTPFGNQDRNSLKLFDLNGMTLNVKSFRVPNAINKFVYRFFRKSKAQRSFEYAKKLMELGIGTPQPIAFYEYLKPFSFYKSYYISIQQECDLTYRELTKDFDYPKHEEILRAFTRFTFQLHEREVHFLDHSPGNTLIKKENEGYTFFLVDLNRMEFRALDFNERIKNFAKLTIHKSLVEVMSDEYAKCIGKDFDTVFSLMWRYTQEFQERYQRKRRLKKKLKFRKK